MATTNKDFKVKNGLVTEGSVTATGNVSGNNLLATNSVGDEGGEILLSKPVTNTTISGTAVTVDVYQNKLRFFENSGTSRGYYIDITAGGASASTNLASGGGTTTNALTIGTGLSGTSFNGSAAVTIANTGVLSVNGSTGAISGIATTAGNLSQFAATTSAQLAGIISDETGSGALVFATSPTLTTPSIGVATGTSFNSITGLSSTTPIVDGTAAVGTATTVARADHVHPTPTSVVATVTGTNSADLVYGNMADNDQFRIRVGGTATNAGFVELATADDGTEPIYVRQYSGVFTTLTRTATLLDGSGNTTFPGTVSASGLAGSLLTSTTGTALGTAAAGTSAIPARSDHVHPLPSTLTIGTGLSGGSYNGSAAVTIANSGVLSVNGGTGAVTGIATTAGTLAQFAATTSAQLAGVVSDETGSGALVFGTSPTLTTPTLSGNTTAGTINSTTIPTSATLTKTSDNLSVFAATTSAQLLGVISDETGSGALVFGTSPAITTSLTTPSTSFNLINTTATTVNFAGAATALGIGAGTGTTTINNNLAVTGNLTINGTTTTVNSTVVTIDDPIFTLGGDTAPTVDDNKDRGIEFRWHNGTTSKIGFFGYDDSIARFTFIPDATNTSEVFSGTQGDIDVNNIYINGTVSTGTGGVVRASSPTLAGTPLSTTAAVDTNTTQIATTAYVIGQGYLKTATASSTYQPLDADLTAIAGLAGTSGFLKKTAANTWTLDTSTYLTGNQSITLSGDVTGSGTTAITTTLANVATAGTYKSVTINAKGLVTSGTNPTTLSGYGITNAATNGANSNITSLTGLTTALSATQGGTAQSTYATGDLVYASAANTLSKRAIGTTGQVLTVTGGVPTWATPSTGTGADVIMAYMGAY